MGEWIFIRTIDDVCKALEDGPVYATYYNDDYDLGHMIVVTGADPSENIVYTNNPWGVAGEQTFEEFLTGFIWGDAGWSLYVCITVDH